VTCLRALLYCNEVTSEQCAAVLSVLYLYLLSMEECAFGRTVSATGRAGSTFLSAFTRRRYCAAADRSMDT